MGGQGAPAIPRSKAAAKGEGGKGQLTAPSGCPEHFGGGHRSGSGTQGEGWPSCHVRHDGVTIAKSEPGCAVQHPARLLRASGVAVVAVVALVAVAAVVVVLPRIGPAAVLHKR